MTMVVAPALPLSWRRAGCHPKHCYRQIVLVIGERAKREIVIHDPAAHEAYGRGTTDLAIVTGSLRIEPDQLLASVDGEYLCLTPIEARLLCHLAERLDRVCTFDDIVQSLWGSLDYFSTPFHQNHTVRVHITRLRGKLGPARTLLATRAMFGYSLRAVPPCSSDAIPGLPGWATRDFEHTILPWGPRQRAILAALKTYHGKPVEIDLLTSRVYGSTSAEQRGRLTEIISRMVARGCAIRIDHDTNPGHRSVVLIEDQEQ